MNKKKAFDLYHLWFYSLSSMFLPSASLPSSFVSEIDLQK